MIASLAKFLLVVTILLFAEDTYALTNFPHIQAQQTYHEWLLDSLSAAASNSALEGNDPTYATITNPTRVGNYCQITHKNFLVSGTLEATTKAGRARESARQAMKKMRELKNDMEWWIVRNGASRAGDVASARTAAGMESWIATNDHPANTSTGQTTAGFLSGLVAAPTDGTQVAASEGAFKTMLGLAWAQGGDPRIILTNTSTKAVIDGFTGIVTRNIDMTHSGRPGQAAIIGAANVYVSSYGIHTVILHRHVRGVVIMAIDPEYWSIAFLRNPFMEELAKTGDARKYAINAEWTLVSRNQAASAKLSCVQ